MSQDDYSVSDDSVDTHDAFMDMLGLSSNQAFDEIVEEEKNHDQGEESQSSCKLSYSTIPLPEKCSRHLSPSSLALIVDNVLTENQCNFLKEAAHDSSNGFNYITEAVHKTPDGSSYTVQIQNPNPHKLAVLDTDHGPMSSLSPSSIIHETKFQQQRREVTNIMDQLYDTISKVLNHDTNTYYQNFVSRSKCGNHKGLNPRMRILKYDADHNDRFDAHFDATTFVQQQPNKTKSRYQSLITVLVYLNDGGGEDFEDGETIYLDYHYSATTTTTTTTSLESGVKVTPQTGRVVLFEHDLFHSGLPLKRGTKFVMRTDVLFNEIVSHDQYVNKEKKEAIKYDNNDDDDDDDDGGEDESEPFELIIHLCQAMNLSNNELKILEDMDLLHVTLDAFISPGVTLLKNMLVDGGLSQDLVTSLVNRVTSERSSSSR